MLTSDFSVTRKEGSFICLRPRQPAIDVGVARRISTQLISFLHENEK